jgi:hypothetical protein
MPLTCTIINGCQFLGDGIVAFVFVAAMVAEVCIFYCCAAIFIVILWILIIILSTVAPFVSFHASRDVDEQPELC